FISCSVLLCAPSRHSLNDTLPLHDALPIYLDIAELSPEEIQQRIARLPKIGGLEPAVVIRVDKNSVLALPQRGEPRQIDWKGLRSEEHTSELQSRENLVCRLLLEKKKDLTA